MMGDHRLVGGNKSLAGAKRASAKGERRAVGAANEFDNDINIAALAQRGCIIDPCHAVQREIAAALSISRRNGGYGDRPAGAARYDIVIGSEQLDDAAADIAKPGKTDAQGAGKSWAGHRVSAFGQGSFIRGAAGKAQGPAKRRLRAVPVGACQTFPCLADVGRAPTRVASEFHGWRALITEKPIRRQKLRPVCHSMCNISRS
jgi:hypothetical protein